MNSSNKPVDMVCNSKPSVSFKWFVRIAFVLQVLVMLLLGINHVRISFLFYWWYIRFLKARY